MKKISVVTGCYNEKENIESLAAEVGRKIGEAGPYDYEHIIIDNGSTDGTPDILRRMAASDRRIKVILNNRNFGHVRSFYHAMLQITGEAVILIAADFQEPPELIPQFLKLWESGSPVVQAVKNQSEENPLMFAIRSLYYRTLNWLSDVPLIRNATGFGLYDRKVIEELKKLNDPYPYFRGLVCDLGFPVTTVNFVQPVRRRGITKNNWYTLYDMAMLGITNHSKIPLRLAALTGFVMAFLCFLVGMFYLVYKLVYWDEFRAGVAPLVIGLFFFASVQLVFIGILGEYIGAIHTQVLRRPLVTEKERLNFDDPV